MGVGRTQAQNRLQGGEIRVPLRLISLERLILSSRNPKGQGPQAQGPPPLRHSCRMGTYAELRRVQRTHGPGAGLRGQISGSNRGGRVRPHALLFRLSFLTSLLLSLPAV